MIKGRFFSWALPTVIAPCTVLLVGCSTTESRISDHRDLYAGLPPRQQQLVAQGQIAPGMSENAVWLAWGSPGQRVNGFARGHSTETWVYFGYTNAYPYGYGYGYGRFGYGYPGFYGGGVGVFRTHLGHRFVVFRDPVYDPLYVSYIHPSVQYQVKTVTFVIGRVVEFQHLVVTYRY